MLLVAFIPKSGNTIIEGYGLNGESQILWSASFAAEGKAEQAV
jgi:hypothetical protein